MKTEDKLKEKQKESKFIKTKILRTHQHLHELLLCFEHANFKWCRLEDEDVIALNNIMQIINNLLTYKFNYHGKNEI